MALQLTGNLARKEGMVMYAPPKQSTAYDW